MSFEGCFVTCHRDRTVLEKSSSGGMFSAFAEYILNRDGVVIGATFDEVDKKVKHIGITEHSDLNMLRKSKYVFSDFVESIGIVEKSITDNRYILFTGTPCQAATIRKRFGDYSKLFIVDLFCHGTLEPRFLMEYLNSLDSEIKDVRFREQEHNSKDNFQFCVYDNNGLLVSDLYINNPLTYLFLTSEGIRDACFSCKYASVRHFSDITIGDWDFDYPKEWDDLYEFVHPSIAVVNNEKGRVLFEECAEMFYSSEINNSNQIAWYYREHHNMNGFWGYDFEKKKKFYEMMNKKGFIYSAEYSMYERERELVEKALKKGNRKLCLYGCGNNGKRVSKVIEKYYSDRVDLQYFVVTRNTENIKVINDRRVFELQDICDELKTTTIVITVGKEDVRKEIELMLNEKGITNYVSW